jgi:hypothetical protein
MAEVIIKVYWLIKTGIKAAMDECNSGFEDPLYFVV